MSYETILTDLDEHGILTLTINRPERKNAFNIQQYNELTQALQEAIDNDDVLVTMLTATGNVFSAGQDLTQASAPASTDSSGETGGPAGFTGFAEMLQRFDKPLLAAVEGTAVGVGVTLLFNCDVVYIGESSRFRMPFTALGICPEAASSVLLPMLVGHQKAAEIFFTSRWIDAAEFHELGLCSRVCPDGSVLDEIRELAREISDMAPTSVRETKRLLLAGRADAMASAHQREVEALGRLFGQPESLEAVMAFMQKRKPDFRKLRAAGD